MVHKGDVIVSLVIIVVKLLRHRDGVRELLVNGLHGVGEGDGVTGDVIQLDGGGHLVRLVVSDIIGGAARSGIQVAMRVSTHLFNLVSKEPNIKLSFSAVLMKQLNFCILASEMRTGNVLEALKFKHPRKLHNCL